VAVYDSNCLITFSYQITGNSVTFLPSNANYGMGTFYWSFGDNSSSSEITPTHYYNQTGEYSVCLWYTDSNCSSHFCDTINITAGDSCYAEFTVYEYNGVVSFHPTFIDYSKMYSWDFGDGTSSNEVTPYHEYPSEGGYVVCLTVSAFFCSATHCDSVYYSNDTTNNGSDCIAKFEVGDIDTVTSTIWLTDLSQGGIQYFWENWNYP
jgi:PKD repeat protein